VCGPATTVVVTDDRITEVAPAARLRVSDDAQQVDGRGKFLIPGLWGHAIALGLTTYTQGTRAFRGAEIEKGKLANLVLLDANPLIAISNTMKINAVVTNGRLFRKTDLADLLAGRSGGEQMKTPYWNFALLSMVVRPRGSGHMTRRQLPQ
jgi:cytosine/adenosine deaminase-related metal-dependent hydrolase